MEQIREIPQESNDIYWAPKITYVLQEQCEAISEKTVENYMREMGLKALLAAYLISPYGVPMFAIWFVNAVDGIIFKFL